jgi:hypothetical protein
MGRSKSFRKVGIAPGRIRSRSSHCHLGAGAAIRTSTRELKQIRRFSGCQFGLLLPHEGRVVPHSARKQSGSTCVRRSPGEVRRAIPPAPIQAMALGASFFDEKLLATCRASGQNLQLCRCIARIPDTRKRQSHGRKKCKKSSHIHLLLRALPLASGAPFRFDIMLTPRCSTRSGQSTECHNLHHYAGESRERTRVLRPFGDEVQAHVRTEAFVHSRWAEAE